MAEYTPDGRMEIPDPTPLEVPLGWKAPLSMEELIRRHIRGALSQQAEAQGQETFEEANDFEEADDETMPMTPYMEFAMAQPDPPRDVLPDPDEAPPKPPAPANVADSEKS